MRKVLEFSRETDSRAMIQGNPVSEKKKGGKGRSLTAAVGVPRLLRGT